MVATPRVLPERASAEIPWSAVEDAGSALERSVRYEEYHPFGTTAWHAHDSTITARKKRYRYTGKEKDEETGLNYHGARYYAPWLGRWCSADPAGMVDGPNRYAYVRNNPVGGSDPTGTQEVPGDLLQSIKISLGTREVTPQEFVGFAAAAIEKQARVLAGAAGGWAESHPRLMGALQAVGGLGEAAAGVTAFLAPDPTMATKALGSAAIAHGTDAAQAGGRQMASGTQTRTATSIGIEAGALAIGGEPSRSRRLADVADASLGIGLSFGAGAAGGATAAPQVAAAAQETVGGGRGAALRAWWLRGAEGDQAYQALPLREKVLYELGQKTMRSEDYARFADIGDPVARGRAILAKQGLRAFINEGAGWRLGAGETLSTGPTPGLRLAVPAAARTVGATGRVGGTIEDLATGRREHGGMQ